MNATTSRGKPSRALSAKSIAVAACSPSSRCCVNSKPSERWVRNRGLPSSTLFRERSRTRTCRSSRRRSAGFVHRDGDDRRRKSTGFTSASFLAMRRAGDRWLSCRRAASRRVPTKQDAVLTLSRQSALTRRGAERGRRPRRRFTGSGARAPAGTQSREVRRSRLGMRHATNRAHARSD